MKNKFLIAVLSAVTALSCVMGFTACGDKNGFEKVEGSTGLEYTLSEDESFYYLSGWGTCADTEITVGNIYDGKPVTRIGKYICTTYEEMEESGVLDLSEEEFNGAFFFACKNVKSITVPEGITQVGYYAFAELCEDEEHYTIETINLPQSLKTIGYGAFTYCKKLESIIIPANVIAVGEFAFYGCEALTEVIIPDGVSVINGYTFYECAGLESVTLPAGVSSIGEGAFLDCGKLTSIKFKGTKEQWNAIEKGEDWRLNAGAFTVKCSDGDISK